MSKPGKVLLKDVAKEAGVSNALASYVLNGKHTNRISPETATRVRTAAKKLNYNPDFFAKGLKSQKSHTIGLIIPDLAHPFFTQVARSVEDHLSRYGYTLLIGSSDEKPERQRSLIQSFTQRSVDGLIILPLHNSVEELRRLQDQDGVPCILTDRYFPGQPFQYIVSDNFFGTYALTSHLIQSGKQHIGLVTLVSEMEHFAQRKSGFLEACREAGLEGTSAILELSNAEARGNILQKLGEFFQAHPQLDGLVFTADYLTMGGIKYLISTNLQVPGQIGIAAFDEADYYSIFPFPITYYRQPLDQIGHQLVDSLMKMIDDPGSGNVQRLIRGEILTTSSR